MKNAAIHLHQGSPLSLFIETGAHFAGLCPFILLACYTHTHCHKRSSQHSLVLPFCPSLGSAHPPAPVFRVAFTAYFAHPVRQTTRDGLDILMLCWIQQKEDTHQEEVSDKNNRAKWCLLSGRGGGGVGLSYHLLFKYAFVIF